MTNPPGEGQPPGDPTDPNHAQEQQGYWQQQQQGQQQGQQQPYQQQSYGHQQPYGQQPGYGQMPVPYAPEHPKSTTALVLGILGVVVCQIIGPFAWSVGKRTVAEIDASNGMLGGRGSAQAGYILGIVGTVLLILGVVFFVGYLVIVVAIIGTTATTGSY